VLLILIVVVAFDNLY